MFKINLSTKDGKTYKLEAEALSLKEKKLGNKIKGEDISEDLKDYELEITGASDKAGFTAMKNVQGIGLKKVLLGYGKGMHKRPKGDKKVNKKPLGLRLRKTVRGNTISDAISQINIKILKEGGKKLSEIFPEQNKSKEVVPAETKPEEVSETKTESVTESPKQKEVNTELAQPEQEPKQEKAEKPEEQKP